MSLLITFLVLAASFAALLFVVSLVLQGYLYNQPADRLPLRAFAGGLLAAAFLTLWVYLNTRAEFKDKYGTLFEFNSTAAKPFDQFTAIRRHDTKDGKSRESTAKFVKMQGNFVEGGDTGKPFKMSAAGYFVTAVELPEGEASARFDADLFVKDDANPGAQKPWKPGDAGTPEYGRATVRTFREANGRRYIEFTQGTPGPIQVPNRVAWIGALVMNVLHFLIWFAVFWPVLRFTSGTSLGLAAAMTVTVMLFAMPILFERNKAPAPPPPPPRTTAWLRLNDA